VCASCVNEYVALCSEEIIVSRGNWNRIRTDLHDAGGKPIILDMGLC
jgi:hypothetical protein